MARAKLGDARARPSSRRGCRRSSPAASSSASRSRARWCSSPRCCCSTSRCRTSTRSCAAACAQEIRELQQSLALTVLYVTHDQEEALAVSDHIIVMDGGQHRAAGHAARAVRGAGEPVPRRLHRRREPGRRRARRSTARGASFTAGGVTAPVRAERHAPRARRRWRCVRSGCGSSTPAQGVLPGICKRVAVSRQPHRVRRGDRVGRAAGVRRRGATPRAAATMPSASLSTPTR